MTHANITQFAVLAGAYEIESLNPDLSDPERRMAKRHAREIRELLHHADTEPDSLAAVPTDVPPMPAPRVPIIPEET